jgi:peroxiredoxin
VRIIAINSTDTATVMKNALNQLKPQFSCVADIGGKLIKEVGVEQTPRTFLLDAAGKILWLDLEYSRTTRRQLRQALQAALKEI